MVQNKVRAVYPTYQAQVRHANALMERYTSYAKDIGCTVTDDVLLATKEQGALLLAWWRANT